MKWTRRKGTMRKKMQIIFFFLFSFSAFCEEMTLNNIPLSTDTKADVLAGEKFCESTVTSSTDKNNQETQSLDFKIMGLHPKSCDYALKTLSRYEDFHRFMDFVKESSYDEKTGEINFLLSHTFLPYNMRLIFKLPRVNKVGSYPFKFEMGFLNGLNGTIHVIDHQKRCLFYSTATWKGPHSSIPNFVLEFFSEALSKLSMEVLFRKSAARGK